MNKKTITILLLFYCSYVNAYNAWDWQRKQELENQININNRIKSNILEFSTTDKLFGDNDLNLRVQHSAPLASNNFWMQEEINKIDKRNNPY